ncbi:hypothetical protein EON63_00360 [archaeon]|nr:MAG: hypothetical protein EON63_00360 [archaeon]
MQQPEVAVHPREVPPPTGFGSEEDSLRRYGVVIMHTHTYAHAHTPHIHTHTSHTYTYAPHTHTMHIHIPVPTPIPIPTHTQRGRLPHAWSPSHQEIR